MERPGGLRSETTRSNAQYEDGYKTSRKTAIKRSNYAQAEPYSKEQKGKTMIAKKAEVPERTLKKVEELARKAQMSEETIIQTAMIIGTMKLEEWINEE